MYRVSNGIVFKGVLFAYTGPRHPCTRRYPPGPPRADARAHTHTRTHAHDARTHDARVGARRARRRGECGTGGDGFGMHGIVASVNPQRSRILTPDPLVCTTRKPSVSGDIGPIPSELISAIARKPLKALRVPAHTRPPAPVRPPARVARRTRGGCEKLYAPVNWITQ